MEPDRIAELLQPFLGPTAQETPSSADLEHISTYIDILLRWNSRMNLTALRSPEEIVTRHFGESLFAARHLFPNRAAPSRPPVHLADVGSGAGFPGLPIKLWAPDLAVTLIESNQKKSTFLREITRALRLTNVYVQNLRAGDLSPAIFDVVTLRAVERFALTLANAADLTVPGGQLALMIASSQLAIAHSYGRISWDVTIPVPLSRSRVLLIGQRQDQNESDGKKWS